jgi:hypothetical protein
MFASPLLSAKAFVDNRLLESSIELTAKAIGLIENVIIISLTCV